MPGTLDYLFAADRGQEERFLYSCAGCGSILEVKEAPVAPDHIIDSLFGVCPSCGAKLENSMDCRQGQPPVDWQAPIPPIRKDNIRSRRPLLLQCASSYKRFALDFSLLDRLVQPLSPGNLVMLQGQGASPIAELAAFRAQLPSERGGLDSTVVFVDGGNCSDPYLLASIARRYSVDIKRALQRVTNCRVFTMYQLASLLSNDILELAETYGSKLLVIADLLGTFNEPDSSAMEVEMLLDAIHAGIMEAKKKLVVITTLGSPNRYDDDITPWSDTLVHLSPLREGTTRAELLRHPTRKPDSSEFSMNHLLFHPDSPLEVIR